MGLRKNVSQRVLPTPDQVVEPGVEPVDSTSAAIASFEVTPSGVINIVAFSPIDRAVQLWVEDDAGNRHDLEVLSEERLEKSAVNRIATSDFGSCWRLDPESKALLAESDKEDYRIPGEFTYYVKSLRAATAELVAPITGEPLIVEPLSRHKFQMLAGVHRCNATVIIEVEAEDGEVVARQTSEVNVKFKGGTSPTKFHLLESTIQVPANGCRLRIKLQKSDTLRGDNSYVFFARPWLRALTDAPFRDPVSLPRDLLGAITSAPGQVLTMTVRLREATSTRSSFRGTFVIAVEDAEELRKPLTIPARESLWKVKRFELKGARVRINATRDPAWEKVTIGIFVDGDLSTATVVAPTNEQIRLEVSLAHKHLDGLAHMIEARVLETNEALGLICEIVPSHLTPWASVQQHSGLPLSPAESPAARHHLRALRSWMTAAEKPNAAPLPPLGRLHDELIRGFKKRDIYPLLQFPDVAEPVVSIIIPVHNKFEVTYYCLCSLLFAYTSISFEVIVVDDGSTDATSLIESTVKGIHVVRHTNAAGFVRSCNDGASVARGTYVAFLNNDTEVTAGWLDELVAAITDFENVGLVGAKLVYPDGKLQEAGGLVWRSGNPWNVGRRGNASDPQFNYVRQVDYVSGAAVMLPRKVWDEVGEFSSEFEPGYFEDTDLAMKVRQSGRKVLYVPTAEVFHFEGQSSGTSVSSGMKRYQEVNRPKFKRKWVKTFSAHGEEGVRPDREKDRGVLFRVLFIDHRFPTVDADAGSYAAFQDIRILQSLGAKVTILPRNLAWLGRHTTALQRAGVECLFAPFVMNVADYLTEHVADYDAVYISRFGVAKELVPVIRAASPETKIIFSLCDLHFLRELREVAAKTPGYSLESVAATRTDELAVVQACDLTLSYSDIEVSVLQSHVERPDRIAHSPWVVEVTKDRVADFQSRKEVLFLGGFLHPPNAVAVEFFAKEVLPLLRERRPEILFRVIGSNPTPEVLALASDHVKVEGYVASLDDAFDAARVFVVPLVTGAGLKGKVLEGMSRGMPMVISPVAAEGTGLSNNNDCLIAQSVDQWVTAVDRLYSDAELWSRIGSNAAALAKERFSFQAGQERFSEILAGIDIFGSDGLVYTRAHPRYGDVP